MIASPKFRARLKVPIALAGLIAGMGLGPVGCLTDMDDSDNPSDTTGIHFEAFPRPNGPKILPLETSFRSMFQYVEFDSAGRESMRLSDLPLFVTRRDSGLFGYALEDSSRGWLLRFKDFVNRDSTGVYIVGSYRNGISTLAASPILWLPQHPRTGVTWLLGAGQALEMVSESRPYLTETLFPGETDGGPIVLGYQRHEAIHIRETTGDTVTDYYLRKGVGLLGFERTAGGRLLACATLAKFLEIK